MDETIDYSRSQNIINAFNNSLNQMSTNEVPHIIIGCGGIGYWLSIFLAMNGAKFIVLIDGDEVDVSNLSRLPIPSSFVGFKKTTVLRKHIHMIRPECIVVPINRYINEDNIGNISNNICEIIETSNSKATLNLCGGVSVWDCTDVYLVQKMIYKKMIDGELFGELLSLDKDIRKFYMHKYYRKLGYEGFVVGSHSKMDDVWSSGQGDDTGGYRTTSANAMSSAFAAIIGCMVDFREMEPSIDDGEGYSKDVTVDMVNIVAPNLKWDVRSGCVINSMPDTTSDGSDGSEPYPDDTREEAVEVEWDDIALAVEMHDTATLTSENNTGSNEYE